MKKILTYNRQKCFFKKTLLREFCNFKKTLYLCNLEYF